MPEPGGPITICPNGIAYKPSAAVPQRAESVLLQAINFYQIGLVRLLAMSNLYEPAMLSIDLAKKRVSIAGAQGHGFFAKAYIDRYMASMSEGSPALCACSP